MKYILRIIISPFIFILSFLAILFTFGFPLLFLGLKEIIKRKKLYKEDYILAFSIFTYPVLSVYYYIKSGKLDYKLTEYE